MAARKKKNGLGAVTKKDFEAMADVLCTTRASARTVDGLARYFASQNPRFNASRFKAATKACKR